jgi:hypothetical protein
VDLCQRRDGSDSVSADALGRPSASGQWIFPVNNTSSYYDSGSSYQSGWPTTFGSRVSNPYEIAAYAYFSPGRGEVN